MQKRYLTIQHLLMIKILIKLEIEANHPKIIKDKYEKPTVNTIFNGERLKAFPLKLGTRQGCLLLALLFTVTLTVLARAIKQHGEIKCIQIGMEENKITSVFKWYNPMCRKA